MDRFYFLLVLFFVLGASVGSFLNVLVDRIPRGEDFLFTKSHCEKCKKKLSWRDLVPLFSFILLKGRCRYCHAPLSYYYPVVELVTGGMFVFILLLSGIMNKELGIMDWIPLVYQLVVFSSLIVIFFSDLKYRIIPDKIVFPAIVLTIIKTVILACPESDPGCSRLGDLTRMTGGVEAYLFSALGASFLFFLLFYFTRGRGMGFGDVKLAFFMGLFLGFPNIIVALYVAFLTGAGVSLILILTGKKKFSGGTIAFGPFLVFGTFIAFFTGHEITAYILRTF